MTRAELEAVRQQRILDGLPAARAVAERISRRLPASVDVDDLASAARLGLIDAADRFDGARGVPFEAYAQARMNGAVLDALRSVDPLSRRERRKQKDATAEAVVHVALDGCEAPAANDAHGSDPLADYVRAETLHGLRAALEALTERERLVLSLSFEQDLTYREIGVVLGVSESRVCQILRASCARLRDLMLDEPAARRTA